MSGRHEAYFKAQRERDDRAQEWREYSAMEEKVAQCKADIAELVEALEDEHWAWHVLRIDDCPKCALIAKHRGGQDE